MDEITNLPNKLDLEQLTKQLEAVNPAIVVQRVQSEDSTKLLVDIPEGVTLEAVKKVVSEHKPARSDIERIEAVKQETADAIDNFGEWKASVERRLLALENRK